jgi:SPP1 family predicted phage head-tail adaptor
MRRKAVAVFGAGQLTDRVAVLSSTPVAVSVSSITRTGATATVTTGSAHGFTTGHYITHAGAGQASYNVEAQVTVTSPTAYTFTVAGDPATPATGTITATWTSDATGAGTAGWYTLATVWASVVAMSGREQLQAEAVGANQHYTVRVRYRADVTPKMRLSWTPYSFGAAKTLEIHRVQPDPDAPRELLLLTAGEVL